MTSIAAAQKCKHYDREEIDFYMVLTRESYKFTICLSCGLWLERIGATTAAAEEDTALAKKLNEMRMSQPPPRGWGSSYDRGYDKGWNDALDDIADVLTARGKKEEHKK